MYKGNCQKSFSNSNISLDSFVTYFYGINPLVFLDNALHILDREYSLLGVFLAYPSFFFHLQNHLGSFLRT